MSQTVSKLERISLHLLVANNNSSFYGGWSLSHSLTQSLSHITLQHAHAPVCPFATTGFQTFLFVYNNVVRYDVCSV